ncbi:MAG: TFIIB-type zinc ribbon-containing protein [Planctomycetota bacterium]|jgi:Zn-finger nucleic acid-binding protein
MDCPVCKNAMITLELQEVEIDHCIECGGIWLDSGELEMLLGEQEKTQQLLNSFKDDHTSTEMHEKNEKNHRRLLDTHPANRQMP